MVDLSQRERLDHMTAQPIFTGVNVVVTDMDRSLLFYRRLGLEVNAVPIAWPPGTGGRHATASSTDGPHVEFDNTELARIWGHAGLAPGAPVIGFSFASRDRVDAVYRELVAAGYPGRLDPYNAFFGARYAIVDDPDGHSIGLMSPIDPNREFTPTPDTTTSDVTL
jgi:catechol 2,3-dioxygenase-like lactoylglutathione lyase family enzyme